MAKGFRAILCPDCGRKITISVEELEALLAEFPPRLKTLAELTADDVPPGRDPDDVAIDCRPIRLWRDLKGGG